MISCYVFREIIIIAAYDSYLFARADKTFS